jgi:hypothetical protein
MAKYFAPTSKVDVPYADYISLGAGAMRLLGVNVVFKIDINDIEIDGDTA